MNHISDDDRRRAFAVWLRTGRLPSEDGLELKFNPWHDPANGRFTFAGSGRYSGAGAISHVAGGWSSGAAKRREPAKLPTGARPASTARSSAGVAAGDRPSAKRPQPHRATAPAPRSARRPNPTVEFARGAAEGLSGTAVGAVRGTYALLTTNPATTVRETGRAIAGTIDAAISAEDVPARIQISRATDKAARASAYDLGHAVGSTVGNVALVTAPEATLSKVSSLRRLRVGGSGAVIYDPLEVHWVNENLGPDSPAKRYNDTATGARPSQAPALMRTMPDGSRRPVKFDGIQGEYLIDAKHSIRDQSHAREQLLRQSDVLAQHRLIGVWEVPNQAQRIRAAKMLKRMKINNIRVRIRKIE